QLCFRVGVSFPKTGENFDAFGFIHGVLLRLRPQIMKRFR
ncbi:MAG: hypothetical protein ACI92B_002332, partial [Marinobacter maritimus]